MLAAVLIACGVVVYLALGASKGSGPVTQPHPLTSTEAAHAITPVEALHDAPLGSSKATVESTLGVSPQNPQSLRAVGVSVDPSCIYYNTKGEEFGSYVEYCFRNGKLSSVQSVVAGSLKGTALSGL